MEGIRSESSSAPQYPPWIELPRDVTANILHRLGPMEIFESAQKVCTNWCRVCSEPSLWKVIDMKTPDLVEDLYPIEEMVCRRAVDRSRGELVDISIQRFCTDELLQYVSDRSSHLKRLRLDHCYSVSTHGLMTSLKNFPLLEELHIIVTPMICDVDIESIIVSCPLLKSFSFNRYGNPMTKPDDSLAVAIAKSMPELCHLSLFGNGLSNEGLEAVLEGCSNLESLDLRQCCILDFDSEIGRICLEKIKEVRRSMDSVVGCDWFDKNLDYLSYVDEMGDRMADCYGDEEIDFEGLALGISDMMKSEEMVDFFMAPFKKFM